MVATILGRGDKNLVQITVDTDGAVGSADGVLIATDGHPFWVADLNQWVKATDLQVGQWLQTSSGTWVQTTAITRWTQGAQVHNLTIDDIHTYYVIVGTTPLLVHNCGGLDDATHARIQDTYGNDIADGVGGLNRSVHHVR